MDQETDRNRAVVLPRVPGTEMRSSNVPKAIICRPARPAGGCALRKQQWILRFEPTAPLEIEPLMRWTASRDPYRQIALTFPDAASAAKFAERNDWEYEIVS